MNKQRLARLERAVSERQRFDPKLELRTSLEGIIIEEIVDPETRRITHRRLPGDMNWQPIDQAGDAGSPTATATPPA